MLAVSRSLTDGVKYDSLITDMVLRRRGGRRKKAPAISDLIRREAQDLEVFARLLNTQWATNEAPLPWTPLDAQIGRDLAAVIEAAAELPYPFVSRRAGAGFAALAEAQSFRYHVLELPPQPHTPANLRQHGVVWVRLYGSDDGHGLAAQMLDRFFQNPARARLRRCQQCPRWFVDTTRNKSARRCSRECTIAWSNSQRGKRGSER